MAMAAIERLLCKGMGEGRAGYIHIEAQKSLITCPRKSWA